MNRALAVLAIVGIGCASVPAPTPAPASTPQPATVVAPALAGNLYTRIPAHVGAFKLTERAIVRGVPTDSLFRYSDGSRTTLTVIIYDIAADLKVDADSQKWTAREGDKFKLVQSIRRDRGQLSDFVVAFSDSTRFAVDGRKILEHSIAVPTRYPNGNVTVEWQLLYLISGKFVKVRATIPHEGWQKTQVPSFARELALRMAGGH